MPTSETKAPHQLSLDDTKRKEYDVLRPIKNYKLHYRNEDFPILSFTFAVLAGGEYTLYCDHSQDYIKEYLGYDVKRRDLDPKADPELFQDSKFRITKQRREALFSVLERLEKDRPKAPFPTDEEWDLVMQVLGEELKTAGKLMPSPVW